VATGDKGETVLHVRRLESLEATPLPGTQGAGRPFWSPDSKSLAFVSGGKLKRIDLAGGLPTALCDVQAARGGTWNEQGVILFADVVAGLQRIPASGGTPSPVTQVNREAGETHHYYPQFLPGGRNFLYLVRHTALEKQGIFIGSLDAQPGAPAIFVMRTTFKAAYDAGSGRLLYLQGPGTLMARKLEMGPPRLVGDPATVAEGVGTAPAIGYADFSVSGENTLFYRQGSTGVKDRLVWRDRAGNLVGTIGQPVERISGLSLSPDESRVAYTAPGNSGKAVLWVLDVASGLNTRIASSDAASPRWAPDGKHLYYTTPGGIYRKPADGSGEEELVMKGSAGDPVLSVSPDGMHLLYGLVDIMTLPLGGDGKPAPYLQTKYREMSATFSPDGRWVAYDSDESGSHEIYVQGFPDRRGKWPVSPDTGADPEWRADGKELYWVGRDFVLTAAAVDLQPAGVRPGRADALFHTRGHYHPAHDGRRFLVSEPEDARTDWPMAVVRNWAAGLGK
jgi:eukaryotic-like serine/threonine-protein kinase